MKIQQIVVLEDYELMRSKNIEILAKQYPEAKIAAFIYADEAWEYLHANSPELFVSDLSVPPSSQQPKEASPDVGIQLLKRIMKHQLPVNIVALSSYPETVIRLKSALEQFEGGGFTVASKDTVADLEKKVQWSLDGVIYTRNIEGMRTGDLKPAWFEVLILAYKECLEDRAIAKRMHVSLRTVRTYWSHLYDVLDIYPDEGMNRRILTYNKARKIGLID